MAHYWDQDRRLEARWRRLVREFADSRLGVREFCRVNGLKVSSLHFWHEEFRRRDRQPYEGVSEPSRRAGGRRTDAAEVAPPALPAFVSVRVDGPVVVGERMDGPSGGAGVAEVIWPFVGEDRPQTDGVVLGVAQADRFATSVDHRIAKRAIYRTHRDAHLLS